MTQVVPLRSPMDDRIVEVVRKAALTTARHAVFASRGLLAAADAAMLADAMPEPFGRRLRSAPDSLELADDLDHAEALFVATAAALSATPSGHGAHALLARRDGTVDLATPSGVSTIRADAFPGFADAA